METRTCHHCGNDYYVVRDDALIAYNEISPWLDLVCKRCACYLRGYHKWTITDAGLRICGACFLARHPLSLVVKGAAYRQKRELAQKKVAKGNESP